MTFDMEFSISLRILLSLLTILSSGHAKTFYDQGINLGNDIATIPTITPTTTPDTHGLTLKLSFDELHSVGDFIVEINLLACPTLNGTAARSMKAFIRDRAKSSTYKQLRKSEYDEFHSKLTSCHGSLIRKRDEEYARAHPKTSTTTSTTTTTTTEESTTTTTSTAPPPPAITPKTQKNSAWDKVSNWFVDAYTETTKFFSRIIRRKRDLRDTAVKEEFVPFDHKLQAKQNFEEMIHAMIAVAKRACFEMAKYENYMDKVVEEFIYWIHNYEEPQLIYLSDSYFSNSNLLQLTRKCAVVVV